MFGDRGQPFDDEGVHERAREAWKAAELEPTHLHAARHTAASVMFAAGVNINAVKEFLGHSSITTTLDRYGHLLPGSLAEATDRLDAFLGPQDGRTGERTGELMAKSLLRGYSGRSCKQLSRECGSVGSNPIPAARTGQLQWRQLRQPNVPIEGPPTKQTAPPGCRKRVAVAVLRRKPVEATPNAVESVYRRRHREFLRVATAITGSAELGEDAVQEGLTRALARRSTYRGSGTVEAWLWKVIINTARNLAARAPRSEGLQNEESARVLDDDYTSAVREALGLLSERQRLVLFLRYYADLEYASIAQTLGVRRGTVSATLNQAHAALRQRLSEEVHR